MLNLRIFCWMILAVKLPGLTCIKARQFLLCSLLLLLGCENSNPAVTLSGMTMGTVYNVKILPARDTDIKSLRQGVQNTLDEIDNLMSTYKSTSDVTRFSQAPAGQWVNVSAKTVEVVSLSVYLHKLSAGAFDITVEPLVELWGFGPGHHFELERSTPSDQQITKALKMIGAETIEWRDSPPGLKKSKAVAIDLSAIAKGYAVDQVADYLRSQNIKHALVEVGGEVKGIGGKSADKPWLIGIEKPENARGAVQAALSVVNEAVATSGDYRNYFEKDGVRYSHTIDPRNGRPIRHQLVSVTVVDESTAKADALATAINVMGPEAGFEFAHRHNIPALFIIKDAEGFRVMQTERLSSFLH